MIIRKFRKFFPYFPFVGMVFISTFPAGLSINWTSIALQNYIIIRTFTNDKVLRMLGVPEYYPGTHLAKQLKKEDSFMVDEKFVQG